MFGLFGKKYPLPERYKGIVSARDYNKIAAIAEKVVRAYHNVDRFEDGVFHLEGKENSFMALDNLVRMCNMTPKAEWKGLLETKIKALAESNKNEEDLSDYETVKPRLRLALYSKDFIPPEALELMCKREDVPHTFTMVQIDSPESLRILNKELQEQWGKEFDELVDVARENMQGLRSELTIEEIDFRGTAIYGIFSEYSSSGFVFDLKTVVAQGMGLHGAIVAMPSRGRTFVVPLNNESALGIIKELFPLIIKVFDETPGSIVPCYYWYDGDKYYFIDSEVKDGYGPPFILPEKLTLRLR